MTRENAILLTVVCIAAYGIMIGVLASDIARQTAFTYLP